MSRDPDNHETADANLDRLLPMAASPPQLDPGARARLLARLQRSAVDLKKTPTPASGGPLPMSPRNRPTFAKIAAYALSLAAVGALAWTGVRFFSAGTDPASVSPDSYAVHRNDGQRPKSITLADGSTAILRAGAAVQEHGARRLELLEGEVLLDVRPGDGNFKITAAAGDVEVRGTKFLLRQSAGAELIAGVLRGEVRLFNGAGEAILQAGESGRLSPGTAPARHAAERLSHEVAWARDALVDPTDELQAVRRGNLLARFPNWEGREWPLPVRSMDVDVYIENGVARTTIDQTFFNQTHFELEGVYSFPLPADAAIARLAMYVDGKLMEAGITERQEGREIYESIVYRRRDPALLEWMQGNQFRVRIFPLPARSEKRILLSYTQPLASLYGDYSVRVPIPEYDVPVDTLRYRVHVKDKGLSIDSCCVDFTVTDRGDERLAEATIRGAALGEDLALTLYPTAKPAEVTAAIHPDPGGDYMMVRARPTLPRSSQHVPRRWVVLHDTSASRSPAELAAQTRFLRRLLNELDEADRLTLLAFDSTLRSLEGGFQRVDKLDLAAVDAFLAREARDHVGATELARAVDHALGLFAEDAGPEAPHILYLGDGLVTDRTDAARQSLRERLQGRATFVAAAVGDEVDASLLADLAGATGGLHVQLTPGGDLGWQALDLAAALNTARLQNVSVSLRDEHDAVYAPKVHLSTTSLSDGEALVALTRRTGGGGGPVPSVMVVEGTLAGAPWSQRFELPKPAEGAGYLPRLWARAQIEADVRAGAEAHKTEITALGMEHFLVTPFTSLLVLENEAMYRQFKVRRPSEKDWAHYDAPAEIKVVREPLGVREPAPGTIVLRRPIGLIGSYNNYGYHMGLDDGLGGIWGGNSFPGQLGLIGFGMGGGGVGEGTIGLGNTGLIGKGGGGGIGSGYGRGSGAGFGGRGTRVPTVRTGDFEVGESTDSPNAVTAATKASFVTTTELARATSWSRGAAGGPMRPNAEASSRSLDLRGGFGNRQRRSHFGGGSLGYPLAFHHVGDHRLGDLGEHVPALFEDGFDRERERLLATTADIPGGSITPDARELLEAARARVRAADYAVDDGVLRVEAGGRFTRTRTLGKYLREIIAYDGETLTAIYPDLDLRVVRRVDLAEPALLAQWVPWMLPAPDNLARWYTVTRVGERTLRLALGGQPDTIDLELDASHNLVAVRHRRGDETIGEQQFEHAADGVTIVADGKRTRVATTTAAPDLAGRDAVTTTLHHPLRGDADLVAALAEHAPGSPAWRDVQRQRLAVLAALQQYSQLPAVLEDMHKQAPLTRGELVLGGAGLKYCDDATAARLLAGHPDDPVAAYHAALRKAGRNQTAGVAAVAKNYPGTLPGLLASHVTIVADASRAGSPANLERLRSFLTTYDHPELAYVATYQSSRMHDWRRPAAGAPAWDALAEAHPAWRSVALFGAGQSYWRAGKQAEAAERFEKSLAAAAELGQAPIVDWSVRAAVQSSRGQAGWRMLWNRWRAEVQKSGEAGQLMAFVTAAQQLGEADEVHRVLVGADRSKLDPASGGQLVMVLLNANQISDAQAILRDLLARSPDDPATLELASRVAERQGRLEEAAEFADRALHGVGDLPFDQLRTAYRRILDLRVRLAESIDQPDPKTRSAATGRTPLDQALDAAARWRAEDPDNKEIDERCAALLFTLGQPDEAIRHLDSILERHPGEGDAYAAVAGALEREGRFADADRRWQQAAAVEPTNPTWLMHRAHNLLTTGDTAMARTLAEQVKAGKWQDRFSNSEYEAKELLRQLDAHKR